MNKIAHQEWIKRGVDQAISILKNNLESFTYNFQDSNSVDNFYKQTENVEWTTGFCTGEYWLAYELTGDESFRDAALIQVESFLNRIEKEIDVNHHDMGFLYTPSCVASFKLVGSEIGKKAALLAADHLVKRFQDKGQFIQAWGELGAEENYRLIIDCLLNLPLLYWASEVTGDEKYSEIARKHTKTSLQNLIRPDCSTYHTFFFDKDTGAAVKGVTHQGYRDGSAWARGQAWGIYGTALVYRYTKDPLCKELFRKVTDFYLQNLPEDKIPYWDLDFIGDSIEQGSMEPRDSSAGAIAVCGILEMLPFLEEQEAVKYKREAQDMLYHLIDSYAVTDKSISNGLLLHGVYAKSSPYNPIPKDRGVDECNTWGDYFYLEALIRMTKQWIPYW